MLDVGYSVGCTTAVHYRTGTPLRQAGNQLSQLYSIADRYIGATRSGFEFFKNKEVVGFKTASSRQIDALEIHLFGSPVTTGSVPGRTIAHRIALRMPKT